MVTRTQLAASTFDDDLEDPDAEEAVAPAAAAGEAGFEESPELAAAMASVHASSQRLRQPSAVAQSERAKGSNVPAVGSARFDGDPELDAVEAGTSTIKVGDTGLAVIKVQQALYDAGRYLARFQITGTFSKKTAKALKKFQKEV